MKSPPLASFAIALFCLAGLILRADESPPRSLWSHDNLVAWCVVPFDAKHRNSEDRAAMLERLGFKYFAYDWRDKDIPTFDTELDALAKHHIQLVGWWFPMGAGDPKAKMILETFKRHNVHPQLWYTNGGPLTKSPEEQTNRVNGMANQIAALEKLAAPYGCHVELYSHNGWFGIEENEVEIIQRLKQMGITSVGMVYNFSHCRDSLHDDAAHFPEVWKSIQPYVVTVDLTGVGREGSNIYLTQGEHELDMMRTIQQSGWHGLIGLIAEKGGDAEVTLANHMKGLDWLAAELKQPGSGGPRPFPLIPDKPVAAARTTSVFLDAWISALPFSFTYDGKNSSALLAGWKRTEETLPWSGGQIHRYTFTDPATNLEVSAEVRIFSDFDAVDWVLQFSNGGAKDTPIIENIEPLDWALPVRGDCVLHHARGSTANINDFGPLTDAVTKGGAVQIGSTTGRPSTNSLPFFNLEEPGGGLLGGLGWTGEWSATFTADPSGHTVRMTAGMQRTHLLLHPGEQIRTPRIVLLNWHGGDWLDAQNLWRRFLLAHYSPRAGGQPVTGPVCYGTWGTDPIANKLAQIAMITRERLPVDVYWVDAGWYGKSEGNGNDGSSPWWRNRGSWWPNPATYPDGLKPLGDAVRAARLGFLLWFESEEGDPGTTLRVEHPGWFFYPPNFSNPGTAILNLGNPDALRGITALVSKYVTDAGLAWYRQDFNVNPAPAWAAADTPDRIGMSEIRDVEGLYAFWDRLLAEHPGLLIDNCASGGQRLDLETLSRSFPLWRSDEPRFAIGSQMQTQGLAQWVPLNGGVGWTDPGPFTNEVTAPPTIDTSLLYVIRSGYSASLVFGMGSAQGKTDAWCDRFRKLIEEYREVRPYTYGDFYPLLPYSLDASAMAALQWNRPNKNAGVIVALRRPDCAYSGIELAPRGIDPAAQYEVEVRTGLEKAKPETMHGVNLADLRLEISDKPGSALVFYQKL